MFFKSQISVNSYIGSAKMYSPQCHQTAKNSVYVGGWLRDKDNGLFWNSVHLGSVRSASGCNLDRKEGTHVVTRKFRRSGIAVRKQFNGVGMKMGRMKS